MTNYLVCLFLWLITIASAFIVYSKKFIVPNQIWILSTTAWALAAFAGFNIFKLSESLISAAVIFVLWIFLLLTIGDFVGGAVVKGISVSALYMGRFVILNSALYIAICLIFIVYNAMTGKSEKLYDGIAVLVLSSLFTFLVMYFVMRNG